MLTFTNKYHEKINLEKQPDNSYSYMGAYSDARCKLNGLEIEECDFGGGLIFFKGKVFENEAVKLTVTKIRFLNKRINFIIDEEGK